MSTQSNDPLQLSILQINGLLRERKITSLELARMSVARISSLNNKTNAFLSTNKFVTEQAREVDKLINRKMITSNLAGIPLAHKDMFGRKGEINTFGAHPFFWKKANVTSAVKTNLDECLALDMGPLNMAEFAIGPTGENIHHGRCANPWNANYLSGGSSSGSAAAVASRTIFGSIGSDTGGSIRVPASLCGATGLKPTFGRVSRFGAMTRVWSQDCIGPIARTAEDCAILLEAIAGPDVRDPLCCNSAKSFKPLIYDESILKIGVIESLIADSEGCVADHISSALQSLASSKTKIYRSNWDNLNEIQTLAEICHKAESIALHHSALSKNPEKYSDEARERIEEGLLIPAFAYLQAQSLRSVMVKRFVREVIGSFDVVVLPTVPCSVPQASELKADNNASKNLLSRLTRHTRSFNYLGLPALTVPCGFDKNGLPIGLQIVGRPFDESNVLKAGYYFQRITDWHLKNPTSFSNRASDQQHLCERGQN